MPHCGLICRPDSNMQTKKTKQNKKKLKFIWTSNQTKMGDLWFCIFILCLYILVMCVWIDVVLKHRLPFSTLSIHDVSVFCENSSYHLRENRWRGESNVWWSLFHVPQIIGYLPTLNKPTETWLLIWQASWL